MIGIIGAMDVEVRGIVTNIAEPVKNTVGNIEFTSGTLYGKEVVCAMCNPGKVNAAMCAQIMILKYNPEIIINSGVAGSLTDSLRVFDVAIAKNVVQHDSDLTAFGSKKGYIEGPDRIFFECDERAVKLLEKTCTGENYLVGTIATGDIFVSEERVKAKIKNKFGAIACEMEGGAIAHVCFMNNVKFAVIRIISDGSSNVDYVTFKKESSEQSVNLLKEFIKMYE